MRRCLSALLLCAALSALAVLRVDGVPLPSKLTMLSLLASASNSAQYNFAMQQAVIDVNNARILPVNLTLTWLAGSSDPVALQKLIIPYMKTANETANNYVMMFGDKSSTNTEPNAWYAAANNLTTMLTSATAATFSNKAVWPTVFRTVGADMATAWGFLAMMQLTGWTRIAVVVSVDELGLTFLNYFLSIVPTNVEYTVLTLPSANQPSYLSSLLNVIRTEQYTTVLIMATPGNAGFLIVQAMAQNMLQPNSTYTWFVGSSYCAGSNIVSLSPLQLWQLSAIICIIDGYDTPANLYNFRSRMTNLTAAAKLTASNGLINFQTDFNYAIPAGYDAVWMIATALKAINSTSYTGPPLTPFTISDAVASQLPFVNITGCSGKQLYFDVDNEAPYSVDYLQLNLTSLVNTTTGLSYWAAGANSFNYLGSWTKATNTLTLLSPIQWPSGAKTATGVVTAAGVANAPLDYIPTYPGGEAVTVYSFGSNSQLGAGVAIVAAVLSLLFAQKAMVTLSATLGLLVGLERSNAKKTAYLQKKQHEKLERAQRQSDEQSSQGKPSHSNSNTNTTTSGSSQQNGGNNNKKGHFDAQRRWTTLHTEWRTFIEMAQNRTSLRVDRHVVAWFVLTVITASLLVVIAPLLLLFLTRETDLDGLPIVFASSTLAAAMVVSFVLATGCVLANICHYTLSKADVKQLGAGESSGAAAAGVSPRATTTPSALGRAAQRLAFSAQIVAVDLKVTATAVRHGASLWLWLSVFCVEAAIIIPFHVLQQSFTTSTSMTVSSSVGCFFITPLVLLLPCTHVCVQLVPATVCRTAQAVRRGLLSSLVAASVLLVYGVDSKWYSFAFDQNQYNRLTNISLPAGYLSTSSVWIIPAALCGYGLFMLMGLLIHRHQLSKSVMDVVLADKLKEMQRVSQQLEQAQQDVQQWQTALQQQQTVLTLINSCRPGTRHFALAAYSLLHSANGGAGVDDGQLMPLAGTMDELNELLKPQSTSASALPALSLQQVLGNVIYTEWWKDAISSSGLCITGLGSGLALLALHADLQRVAAISSKQLRTDLALAIHAAYIQNGCSHPLPDLAPLIDATNPSTIARTLMQGADAQPAAGVLAEVVQRLQQYFDETFVNSAQYRICQWMHEQQGAGGVAASSSMQMVPTPKNIE